MDNGQADAAADTASVAETDRAAEWATFVRRVKSKAPRHVLEEFMASNRAGKNRLFNIWRQNGGGDWGFATLTETASKTNTTQRQNTRGLASRDMLLQQYNQNSAFVDRIIAKAKANNQYTVHPDDPDELLFYVWRGADFIQSEIMSAGHTTNMQVAIAPDGDADELLGPNQTGLGA